MLTLLSGVSLGIVFTFFVLDPAPPPALEAPAPPDVVPVTMQEFSDPQVVEVAVTRGQDLLLRSPASGLITAMDCTYATAWNSGGTNVTINDQPLLNLHTDGPLWRDLYVGARGRDVEAFELALSRLQLTGAQNGIIDWGDVKSFQDLSGRNGGSYRLDYISTSSILWLPEENATPSRCSVGIGSSLSPGDPLATVPANATVRIENGGELIEGARQLQVDDVAIRLNDELASSGADAAAIASTEAFKAAVGDGAEDGLPVVVTGALSLVEPILLAAVPPSSITLDSEAAGCVEGTDGPMRVAIVSSSLGQTLVRFESDVAPDEISVVPPEGCTT